MPGPPVPARPSASPAFPTRFGWGMRLLLGLLIFDIVFRSFSVVVPWTDWASQLNVARYPRRWPTRAEMAELRQRAGADQPDPVLEDLMCAADSYWEFFRPWPEASARKKIRTWADGGKWGFVWLCSRLELAENMVGFNEEWPMFSPNVSRRKTVARARLVYDDGSERIVRTRADPEDLCRYSHWFEEKILDHELKVRSGENYADEAFGYCNLLRHRYPTNPSGSALRQIRLFEVRYDFPPPGVDAREWLKKQTGPPARQISPDFYLFDAKSNHGKCVPR